MKKALRYLTIIMVGWLFLNFFIVPLIEPGMIYVPTKEVGQNPSAIGLEYDDIYLKTADGLKINGWFIENKASDKVMLHFHGNDGNIGQRLPIIKLLYNLPTDIFIIDYHGYGKSEGTPSEHNLYLDAQAAYDFLIKEKGYRPDQIVVMGSSLGGAVATYLAANEKTGGLVIQKTFTSAAEMAARLNLIYRKPLIWIRSRFNSIGIIEEIKAPKLIVHSKEDERIPYTMSVDLYKKASWPKKLLLLEKGRHGDLMVAPEYISNLRQILENN